MKQKYSFYFGRNENQLEDMACLLGCVETVENYFQIEFACGVKDGKVLFLSDIDHDAEFDDLFKEFDGRVEPMIFRFKGKIIDCNKTNVRFDISYDDIEQCFCNAKVITRGVHI